MRARIAAERAWLQAQRSAVALSAAARDSLLAALAQRLAATSASVLAELGADAQDADDAELERRVAALPELARLLALVSAQFRAMSVELLQRVSTDAEDLARLAGASAPLRALTSLELGLSDPHGGGHSVIVLELDDRQRVVYKPKDLRIAAWFIGLCEQLAARLPLPLHARPLLLRDGYGYEAFVASAACASDAEVERYYLRAGSYLRLLEVLGGRDFHAENVRAAGEHPVLLDLETVVAAGGKPDPHVSAEQRAWQIRADSLLATGLVPDWEAGRDGAVDHSGLAIRPRLAASPTSVNRARYLDAVIDGYLRTAAALRATDLAGALRSQAALRVRHVARPTPFYTSLLERSLAPELLASTEPRRAFLREALGDGPLAAQELAALLRLDVPLFVAELGRREVRELCADDAITVLPEDPFAVIAERNARAPTPELIESAFATGPLHLLAASEPSAEASASGRADPAGAAGAVAPADDAALLGAAREIGDLIVASAIEAAGPALSWLGLVHVDALGGRLLHRLPPDLRSGTAGVAIVLARLYAVTGERTYAEVARRALQQSLRRLEVGLQQSAAGAPAAELALGWFAVDECARQLADEGLQRRAQAFAARLGPRAAERARGTRLELAHPPASPFFARLRALELALEHGDVRRARTIAGEILAHRARSGRYLPRALGADRHNLSALTGISALADLFVRIAHPGRFRSLRDA